MEPEKKSSGATVGLIVIVIIIILGGLYIWQSKVENPAPTTDNLSAEDSAELDQLDQDVNSASAEAGVDVEGVN